MGRFQGSWSGIKFHETLEVEESGEGGAKYGLRGFKFSSLSFFRILYCKKWHTSLIIYYYTTPIYRYDIRGECRNKRSGAHPMNILPFLFGQTKNCNSELGAGFFHFLSCALNSFPPSSSSMDDIIGTLAIDIQIPIPHKEKNKKRQSHPILAKLSIEKQ